MADDDLEEHLDPELDSAVAGGTDSSDLPGPLTHRRAAVVFGVAALGVAPFAVLAYERGDTIQLGLFAILAGCFLAGAGLAGLLGSDA